MQPHRKNFNAFKTGDHEGQATGTPLPMHPSWCKILHACVCATSAVLEILHLFVLGLHCTITRTSSPHCCMHSLNGRNSSPSKYCACSQMFCVVEFCEVDVIASIPPQLPYHFHCRNHILCACQCIHL
jgi:hypothetical protein